MFGRFAFAIFALVLFAIVLSTSAVPQEMVDADVTEFGLVEDFIKYLRENLKIAKECIDDAHVYCKEATSSIVHIPKCMMEYILQKKGQCNIHNF